MPLETIDLLQYEELGQFVVETEIDRLEAATAPYSGPIRFEHRNLDQYRAGLGGLDVLTHSDEITLAIAIERQRWDQADLAEAVDIAERRELQSIIHYGTRATRLLIETNLPMVVAIAKDFRR